MNPPKLSTLDEANAVIAVLWAQNAALRARIEVLEARVRRDSSNSSRPPSADPPGTPPRRSPPSGRARGAQPGHPAHLRLQVDPERVDAKVAHYPLACAHCAAPLPVDGGFVVGDPVCHQVTELPPVRAVVTEHQFYRVRCPACQRETRATLPPEVPAGAFGPRLQATVAVLSGRYRLSRREVVGVCGDLLGAPVSLGSVDRLCRDTATALAGPVAEIEAVVRDAPVVHADETGWRQAGERRWLWVVVTATVTLFALAASRGRGVIRGLLGEDFAGYLVSDRWSAYAWVDETRRQLCWAHLARAFQALADRGSIARPFGEDARDLVGGLFAVWHAAGADPAQRATLAADMRPIQDALHAVLDRGLDNPANDVNGLCHDLLMHWPLPVDLRHHARRRADQQYRRARPSAPFVRPCSGAKAASALSPTPAMPSSLACSPSPRPANSTTAR